MVTRSSPYLFTEFFASGKEESISPLLTPSSRRFSKYLSLKISLFSAFCLCLAFVLHLFHIDASFFLILVYILSGTPALLHSLEDLQRWELNIDILMTLAAILSVVIGSGWEGALLLVLFELSAAMEAFVQSKTQSALAKLHKISPNKAYLRIAPDKTIEKSTHDIPIGAHIFVPAGEMVPLDGVVTEGTCLISVSHLTGESTPIVKQKGEEVPAGALNLDSSIILEVTKLEGDSTLRKIINLVTHAQENKPKLQRFLDRFGKRYAISIITLSFLSALLLPWIHPKIPYLGIEGSIYRALTFLVTASPCALILGAPTAYLSALSSCAKKGLLLKGGAILDAIASCHIVAFDKTGTLTTGQLELVDIRPLTASQTLSPLEALAVAAAMELHVKHPIGKAIEKALAKQQIPAASIDRLLSIPGSGLQALWRGKRCFLGNKAWISSQLSFPDIDIPSSSTQAYLAIENELFLFCFSDEIRPSVPLLIQQLTQTHHMDVALLTGDTHHNADLLSKHLGISHLFSHLTPEDKLHKVEELSRSQGLIMVGDGVNDAPALGRATVGIAMGEIGSSSAIEASDVVLLQEDLASLSWLIHKAHATLRVIKQNLLLALFVIVLTTTPSLLGFIPLWLAVILHEGGTLLVGLNSLRLVR